MSGIGSVSDASWYASMGPPAAISPTIGSAYVSVGIDWGVYGVPETFVIDGRGRIAYQHIGDIRADDVPMLLQRLKDAQ